MDDNGFLILAGQTWVCLGDSITQDPNGYVSLCEREIRQRFPDRNIQVANAGVSGNKACDMLARFDRDVLAHRPNWVSISVGVNDVWHGFYDFEADRPRAGYDENAGYPIALFNRDLEEMVRRLVDLNVNVLLIEPTVIGDDPASRENVMVAQYAWNVARLADQYNTFYCAMYGAYWKALQEGRRRDPHFALTTDGVHMNSAGARMMAEAVLASFNF